MRIRIHTNPVHNVLVQRVDEVKQFLLEEEPLLAAGAARAVDLQQIATWHQVSGEMTLAHAFRWDTEAFFVLLEWLTEPDSAEGRAV